ncbi:hypothetical protein ACOME3_008327 [Neoechinorhynchus agilis]
MSPETGHISYRDDPYIRSNPLIYKRRNHRQSSLASCWSLYESLCLGFEARAAFTRLVYAKCLKLSLHQCDRIESGYLSSLISTDSYSFNMFAQFSVRVLGSILKFIMVFTFCYLYIDTFAAIAICVYLIAFALTPVYMIGLRLIRKRINKQVDTRLRNLTIYCRFAQTLKMCCLDTVIYKVICRLNKKETFFCALKNLVEANSCTLPILLHSFITLTYIVISFKASGNLPSGVKVFQLMAVSPVLRLTIGSDVIIFFTRFSEVKLSLERLQKLAEDVDMNCDHLNQRPENTKNDSHYAIDLSSLSSSWNNEASSINIRNTSLKIERGTLTYIIGPSKSGKTSLLYSILNELRIVLDAGRAATVVTLKDGSIELMDEESASNYDDDSDSPRTQQDSDFELITLDKVARRYSMCSQNERFEIGGFILKSRTVDAVGWIKLLGKPFTPNKIGTATAPFLILFWRGSHTFRMLSEYCLSRWLSAETENGTLYLGYLLGFVICAGLVLFITITMIGYDTFYAHSRSLARVMGSYSFIFEKVLRGVTFNRLSFDIGVMQNFVPILIYAVGQGCSLISAFMISICCICPVAVAFVLPAILAMAFLVYHQINLMAAGYQMESDTRTNILTHLIATHQGLVSVRASKAEMISEFEYTIDTNNQLRYTLILLDRIAQFTVDFVILLVMLVTTNVFLYFYNGTTEVGQLAVTYTIVVAEIARLFIQQAQISINHLLSAARVFDLYDAVQEPNTGSWDEIEKPPYVDNSIEFINVRFKYFKDLPFVLNGLDLRIMPRSKVAIVGPTGAGKSTIFGAIFRLGIVEGKIIVGGIDTESMNLNQLRRGISLLPQEAVLMKTSIRLNLDPFQEKSDTEIWDVLQKVGLDNRIRQSSIQDRIGIRNKRAAVIVVGEDTTRKEINCSD